MTEAFKKLFSIHGAASQLARDLGISRSAIAQWKKVPAERVVDVERYTGIPREELRPDIFRSGRA